MKTFIVLLCNLLAFSAAFGQLIDDFSDGNITQNPSWFGDATLFEVENEQLKLNDTAFARQAAYLTTIASTSIAAETTWEIKVDLNFNPSTSNFLLVYLGALQPNLEQRPDGYFLRIGDRLSQDAIELYVRSGGTDRLILSGTEGAVAESPSVNIRVVRNPSGVWSLFADYTGGDNLEEEATGEDLTFESTSFFGILCNYTSQRTEGFRFDDIRIDPIVLDQQAPILLEVTALDAFQVEVTFDEPIDASSVVPTNFSIDNEIGVPLTGTLNETNPTLVTLTLANPLQNLQTYEMSVVGVTDLVGNSTTNTSAAFTYIEFAAPQPNDIIISEVFADPDPSRGLPEAEFIELYNRSDKVIQLAEIGFSSGSTPKSLPEYTFMPGTYLILTDEDVLTDFQSFGNVVGIASFPALTNGGDELTLSTEDQETIFVLAYEASWYQDPTKQNGGYTLEMIDLDGPFNCAGNWRASLADIGGTPGAANSWLGQSPDEVGPNLIKVFPTASNEISLTFDEVLDVSMISPLIFTLDNDIQILDAIAPGANSDQILLLLATNLEEGVVYELSVGPGLSDCLGNQQTQTVIRTFGLPEPMTSGDLLINEVLFHPQIGGVDFVEIYNFSDKVLNLNGLTIENIEKLSGNISQAIETDFLIFPGTYVVITANPEDIMTRYRTGGTEVFLENTLPTLEAGAGNVTLKMGDIRIDSYSYSADQHLSLLDNERGVSLERISFNVSTDDPDNWHSAAATVGFATPGLENSQFFNLENSIDQMILIPEKTISPDGDGFRDVLLVQYETDQPGYVLNARIFDVEGREVFELAKNELLGNRGTLKWDGITNESSRARIGIYIIWFELFDLNGGVTTQKQTIAVAGNL